jgi:hypothetical protein
MSKANNSELVVGGGAVMAVAVAPSADNHTRYRRVAVAALMAVGAGLLANEVSLRTGHGGFRPCPPGKPGDSCGTGQKLHGSPPLCYCK